MNTPSASDNVQITIVNNAGSTTPLADPFISVVGTVNGTAQNFFISSDGTCSPVQSDGCVTVIQLSALTGSMLQFSSTLSITAGRIYFSTSPDAVTTAGISPTTAEFYYDWIEFALNSGAPNQLVVNTTQVDQFGFPIQLTINPPDANFGASTGIIPTRDTLIADFQSQQPDYTDCLFPAANPASFFRILSPNQAIVNNPQSSLTGFFTAAVDDFFTFYTTNKLYLNSDEGYPYEGAVTTFPATGTDGNVHSYPVLQFNFATNAPVNAGMAPTPPEGTGPYNIYYPFFTTNNPAGHTAFNGGAILPPPQWWAETIAAGTLDDTESASQMIFAGNGIFADTFWQLGITTTTPTIQANLLGNLENQVNVAFNRGHATSWFTLCGSIAASSESAPPYTAVITLSGSFTDQQLPNTTASLTTGMNVISFAAGIPLQITGITSTTQFTVQSQQPILAQNPLYLTFANLYAEGATFNGYGQFFHQPSISIGGRAYALSFDDQGGFSSTLTSNWADTPSALTITLGAWW